MDISRMGMSGHSFGANTTQIMAGQLFGKESLSQLYEPRFKAGITYSPVATSCRLAPEKDIYGAIKIPLFHMTGTADDSPLDDSSYKKRLAVFEQSGEPDQHLLVLKDGDHMVFAGSRGKLAENPKRHLHENIIKIASLAFWDAYLRQDPAAKDWLAGGGFADWIGGEGSYAHRPASVP